MAYDEDDAERVRALLGAEKNVTEKKMFGGLAFLIQGHMAVAVSGRGGLMLRCDPDDTADLLAQPGIEPMVMSGREVRGWLRTDTSDMADDVFAEWVGRGVAYARSLPPKN